MQKQSLGIPEAKAEQNIKSIKNMDSVGKMMVWGLQSLNRKHQIASELEFQKLMTVIVSVFYIWILSKGIFCLLIFHNISW